MEGGPSFSLQDMSPEVLQQPPVDLLQFYGDREVTLFGVTGTLTNLAGMCPLDLNDPSKLDTVNTFVAKVANESGIEIDPKHESLFSKVIEETGVERKFLVAAESNINVVDLHNEKADSEQNDKKTVDQIADQLSDKNQALIDVLPEPIHDREEVNVSPSLIEAIRAHQQNQTRLIVMQDRKIEPTQVRDKSDLSVKAVEAIVVDGNKKLTIETKAAVSIKPMLLGKAMDVYAETTGILKAASLKNVVLPVPHYEKPTYPLDGFGQKQSATFIPTEDNHPEVDFDSRNLNTQIDTEELTQETFDSDFDKLFENYDFFNEPEQIDSTENSSGAESWKDLLYEPSESLVDKFAFGLESFADKISTKGLLNPRLVESYDADNNADSKENLIESHILPLFQLVAERLAVAENKDETTLKVQNIVGAIHGIRFLEEQGANLGQIELFKAQLLEFSTELFQQLGIDCDEELIKLFAWTLLRPEYVPLEPKKMIVDYEELGTHESKQEPNLYFNPSYTDKKPGYYILGGLAVLYTTVLGDLRARPIM